MSVYPGYDMGAHEVDVDTIQLRLRHFPSIGMEFKDAHGSVPRLGSSWSLVSEALQTCST